MGATTWDESKHPRAADGRFGQGSGSGRAQAIKSAAKLMAESGKKLAPKPELIDLVGETVTPDEAEQLLIEAGVEDGRAWSEEWKTNEEGKVNIGSVVIAARHHLQLQDSAAISKANIDEAGDARVVVLKSEESDWTYAVHPSAQSPGKWQLTQFGTLTMRDGTKREMVPWGHTEFDNRDDAIKSASGDDPRGPYWNEGDTSYKVVEKHNRVGEVQRYVERYRRKPAPGQRSIEWNEEDHPRRPDGKFGTGGSTATVEPPNEEPDPDDPWEVTKRLDRVLGERFDEWTRDQPGLASEYRENFENVVRQMPNACKIRLANNCKSMQLYESVDACTEAAKSYGSQARGKVGGFWLWSEDDTRGELGLGPGYGPEASSAWEKLQLRQMVWAHEFAHAVDGRRELSLKTEWILAWEEEIKNSSFPPSEYSTSNAIEGFAEYGRMIFTGRAKEARLEFPKCWQFWKNQELL